MPWLDVWVVEAIEDSGTHCWLLIPAASAETARSEARGCLAFDRITATIVAVERAPISPGDYRLLGRQREASR